MSSYRYPFIWSQRVQDVSPAPQSSSYASAPEIDLLQFEGADEFVAGLSAGMMIRDMTNLVACKFPEAYDFDPCTALKP